MPKKSKSRLAPIASYHVRECVWSTRLHVYVCARVTSLPIPPPPFLLFLLYHLPLLPSTHPTRCKCNATISPSSYSRFTSFLSLISSLCFSLSLSFSLSSSLILFLSFCAQLAVMQAHGIHCQFSRPDCPRPTLSFILVSRVSFAPHTIGSHQSAPSSL